MLTLVCGTPGSGKTLYAISQLHKVTDRLIYYHGIKDLILPWHKLDDPKRWFECPKGSIIVIDECQDIFPATTLRGQSPEHIGLMNVHRHFGYDIWLISQNPSLINSRIRALVGAYIFLDRPANLHYAVVWKFRHVCDWKSKTERAAASSERWRYDKKIFDLYKSAEVHTHKTTLPKWVYALPLFVGIIAFVIWFLISTFSSFFDSDQKEVVLEKSLILSDFSPPHFDLSQKSFEEKVPLSAAEYAFSMLPRVKDVPWSAPRYDNVTEPTTAPRVAGCLRWEGQCTCYSQQATIINVSWKYCINFVANGAFMDFDPDQDRSDSRDAAGMSEPLYRPAAYPATGDD